MAKPEGKGNFNFGSNRSLFINIDQNTSSINNSMAYGPEIQCRIHNGSPIIPILSQINLIPCIDTYLFKVDSKIAKLSVQFRGPVWRSWTLLFLQCEVVGLTPNPQAEGPLLVGGPRLLIQYMYNSKMVDTL